MRAGDAEGELQRLQSDIDLTGTPILLLFDEQKAVAKLVFSSGVWTVPDELDELASLDCAR